MSPLLNAAHAPPGKSNRYTKPSLPQYLETQGSQCLPWSVLLGLRANHKREHLHLVSGDSCLGLLCEHIQPALIEYLFTRENYVSNHRWSGVRAAVDSQIRTGDVRRLRTSHERYQRGNFVNRSVAVQRCSGLLGCGPIARGGI